MNTRLLLTFLAVFLFFQTGVSGTNMPATVSLVRSISPDLFGIHIKLDTPWKTYWHTPGEAGIAPTFDWSSSTNLESARIIWPDPVVELSPIQQNVYVESVILPVVVTPKDATQPISLDLKAHIGLCADVCIPASFHVHGDIDTLKISYTLMPQLDAP